MHEYVAEVKLSANGETGGIHLLLGAFNDTGAPVTLKMISAEGEVAAGGDVIVELADQEDWDPAFPVHMGPEGSLHASAANIALRIVAA